MNGSHAMHAVRAGLEHADAAASLFDSYRQFYGQSPDLDGARRFLSERLNRQESVVYLAIDSETGEAVGFMQLYPTFSSISMQRVWILNDLFVRETYRKRGVGRLLLETARRHGLDTDAKVVSLSTALDNAAAQSLYEAFGFEQDQQFYHYDLNLLKRSDGA